MATHVTIRDVDEDVFREFKAAVVKKGLKLGTAVSLAMEKFQTELSDKKIKFTSHKPTHWGKEHKHVSEQVDDILYGA